MMTADVTNSLVLRNMANPPGAPRPVQLFSDWRKACEHLRDHLLTAPECEAWVLVIPEYRQILDPADEEKRWRFFQESLASQGTSAQAIYDLYSAAVNKDAADSVLLGWWRSCGDATVAVGSSGILFVLEDVVKTAFLPGQSEPEIVRKAKIAGNQTGLVRDRGMRSGRPGRFASDESEKEQREREKREAQWADGERLYYRVFKPAIQFIRKCHHRQRDMNGRLVRRDYALLKDALPPQSQLKFQHWKTLREQCGRK